MNGCPQSMHCENAVQNIFDAHLHIIDPSFPLIANQGFLPEPFTAPDYLQRTQALNITGGVIVSGSFQGFDNSYLASSLKQLNQQQRKFAAVINAQASLSDQAIIDLHQIGVRAMRFNIFRMNTPNTRTIIDLATRIYELAQWHCEFYIRADEIKDYLPLFKQLPAFCIDHLGLTESGQDDLLTCIDLGAKIKACGFSRGDLNIPDTLKRIHSRNPLALMFASDLPSTRAPREFSLLDLEILYECFTLTQLTAIMHDNARQFYNL